MVYSSSIPLSLEPVVQRYHFGTLKNHPKRLDILEQVLNPEEGSKENLLDKIKEGRREGLLLFRGIEPVGILIYKTQLLNKLGELNLVKSLFVQKMQIIKPYRYSGEGLDDLLLNKTIEIAKELNANNICIQLQESDDNYKFLKEKNFQIAEDSNNKRIISLYRSCSSKHSSSIESEIKEKAVKSTIRLLSKKRKREEELGSEKELGREEDNIYKEKRTNVFSNSSLSCLSPPAYLPKRQEGSDNLKERYPHPSSSNSQESWEKERHDSRRCYRERERNDSYNRSYSHRGENRNYSSHPRDNRSSSEGHFNSRSKSSKFHPMTLKNEYLQQIKSGAKTVEGRINSGFFKNCKAGEGICFFNQQGSVNCTITKKINYSSFEEMVEAEGYQSLIPNVRDKEAAIRAYHVIRGYKERARINGVVALRLKKED